VIIVFLDDQQILAASDTSFTSGKIGLWASRNGPSQYDNIVVLSPPTQAIVGVKTPGEYFVTPTSTLNVSAVVNDPTTIGGMEFVIDPGTANEVSQTDLVAPYTAAFSLLSSGTHQIRAYGLDSSSQRLTTPGAQDTVPGLGVNGRYLVGSGDSITDGVFDNQSSDDVSQDGRNTCGGYEPVLNNQLTANFNQPITVIDEGRPGDTSTQYVGKIGPVLAHNPTGQAYLVLLGTNDAGSSLPPPSGLGLHPGDAGYPGSYKESMQNIVNAILATGSKKVFLAKVLPFIGNATKNTTVQQYNQVIDELVTDNAASGLVFVGPDFYSYFTAHPEQVSADGIHPNGTGYAAMAPLWKDSLVGFL
jgi:lysophospholipase L1-like esterase